MSEKMSQLAYALDFKHENDRLKRNVSMKMIVNCIELQQDNGLQNLFSKCPMFRSHIHGEQFLLSLNNCHLL